MRNLLNGFRWHFSRIFHTKREDATDAEARWIAARWKKTPIAREMDRALNESLTIIDRYHANPCPETFAALRKVLDHQRRHIARAEESRESLSQMASDLVRTIEKLRQGVAADEARGDHETAGKRKREQASFEALLVSVQENFRQAEETLNVMREVFARSEERLAREAARFTNRDS